MDHGVALIRFENYDEMMLILLKERSLEGASASTCHDQPRG